MKTVKLIVLSLFFVCILSSVSYAQNPNVKLPPLCVRGIVFDKENPLAIINEKYVGEGDMLLGAKVVEIAEKTVRFQYEGQIFIKEVGQDCLNIVGPSDETIYLGERKENLPDLISRIVKLPTAKDAKSKREAKELERRLSSYFQQNMALVVTVVLLLFILPYIYYAICLQMIATKTGTENAWMAWIPIINIYLECKIAGKPGWWLLLRVLTAFIPFAGLLITSILTIIVWMSISEVRSKPAWLGILSIIPILNLFLLGYLAFSKGEILSDEEQKKREDTAIDIGTIKKYEA
ncbi:DUF5684 domain-containing protein [Candidatus Omnitrophota bacterium]